MSLLTSKNNIMFTKNKTHIAIFILVIVYLVGVICIAIPMHEDFILLTPLNLLLSMGLLLWTADNDARHFYPLLGLSFLWGFGAEVIGVHTGLIFGNYIYGEVLGFKLWDTPLLIGLNWAMLLYAGSCVVNALVPSEIPQSYFMSVMKAIIVAALMTGLDMLIEPVAIVQGFWQWEGSTIPIQNYIGWFVVSLPLAFLFQVKLPGMTNKVAVVLFILQVLFFGILGGIG